MQSASRDDETGGTDPVTPVKALTNKRLAVASPFSSASPQHRRPLKARNSSLEGDANIDATMNESTLMDMSQVGNDQSMVEQNVFPLDEINEEELDETLAANELGGQQDSSFGRTDEPVNTVNAHEEDAIPQDTVTNLAVSTGQSLADELGLCDQSFGQVSNTPTSQITEGDTNAEVTMGAGHSPAKELGGLCDNSFGKEDSNIPTPIEGENKLDASVNAGQSLADELGGHFGTSFGQEVHNTTPTRGETKLEDIVNTGPSLADELVGLDTSVASTTEKVTHSNEAVSDSCNPSSDSLDLSDIIGTVSYPVNTSGTSASGLSSFASELAGIVSDGSPKRPLDLSNTQPTEEATVEPVSLTEEQTSDTISPTEQSFTNYLAAPPSEENAADVRMSERNSETISPPEQSSTAAPRSEENAADVSMAEISAEEVTSNKSSFTPKEDDSDRTPTRDRSVSGPGRISPTQSGEDVLMPLPSFHDTSMTSPSFNGRSSKWSDSMVEFIMHENDTAREDDNARAAEFQALKEESVRLKETIATLEAKLAKEVKTRDQAEKDREDFKYMFEDGTARAKKKETDFRQQIMSLEDRLREAEENSEGSKALQEKVDLAEERARSSEESKQRLAEDLKKMQTAADILFQEKAQSQAAFAQLKEAMDSIITQMNMASNSALEMEQRLSEQTSRVAELEESILNGAQERNLVVTEVNILREKLEEMESEELAAQDRVRVAEDQADKLATQVKELQACLESRRQGEAAMTEELTALRQKLDASASPEDLEIMKERALTAERTREDAFNQLQAALQKIEEVRNAAAEETAALRQQLEDSSKQDELESMKEEARIAAKEKEELANTIGQLEQTVQDLKLQKGEIEKNVALLQEKFDRAIQDAESLSAQHEELRLRQEAADEMLLEEKAVGEELRSQLKIASEERSAFEGKLSQAEQAASIHKKTAEDLREQLRVLTSDSEASQDAVRMKCAELEMKLEMAESELGTLASLRDQLKTTKVRNAELEMKIEVCRKRLDDLNDTRNQLAEAQERVEELEMKLKVIDSEGGEQEERCKKLSDRIDAQAEATARMEVEKTEIQKQLHQLTKEIVEMAAKTEEAVARAAEKEEILSAKTAEIETLRRQLDTVATQAAESAEVVAKLTSTNKDLEKSLEEKRRSAVNVLPAPASNSSSEEEEKLKNKIEELEQALVKEKGETEKAWQMCDEADVKEAEFQRRISLLIEENNVLKSRLGENSIGGLLDVLRPAGMQELPSGSPVADRTGSSLARSSPSPTLETDYDTADSSPKKTPPKQDKTCAQQ